MSDDGSVKFWRTQCKNAQAQVQHLEEEVARHRAPGGAADGSHIGQAHAGDMSAVDGEQAIQCPACGVQLQLQLATDLSPEAAAAAAVAAAPGVVCPSPACNHVLNMKLKLGPTPA